MFTSTVNTKYIGLFGDPLGQSAAAYLHNSVYQHLGMDCFYGLYEMKMDDIGEALKNLRRFHFAGASVTMPFKTVVYKYLDELAESAKCTEVVNTIVVSSDGRLTGHNADGSGCVSALQGKCGLAIKDHRYLILGAGGAASAVAAALAQNGAPEVRILNIKKDFAMAEKLKSRLDKFYPGVSNIGVMNDGEIKESLKEHDVVIHATRLGMFPNVDQVLFDTSWLKPSHTVMDVVYVPAETRLLREAKAIGCKTMSGLWMNVNGAATQMKLWFGIDAPLDFMYSAEVEFLRSQGRLGA